MDKVKITRKQADLLDKLDAMENAGVILMHLSDWQKVITCQEGLVSLHRWYIEDPLTVSKALIVGYEVEETPEDKIKKFYDEVSISHGSYTREDVTGIIRNILIDLNIKIEGIN